MTTTAAASAALRAYKRDDSGAMTIYFLIMSLLMFGILGVVIDSSRGYVAHTNMQDYIDDWVLAAANELDGEPDAIDRAKQVLDSALITKKTGITAEEGDTFEIDKVYFLSGAPKSRNSQLRVDDFRDLITTDPAKATHVLVTAEQREIPWTLLNFVNLAETATSNDSNFDINTWAAATLVNDKYCVEPLLAICAPSNLDLETLPEGTQIRLDKNRGGNFTEGEYGVVTDIADDKSGTCSSLSGVDRLECLLAIDTHDTQCGDDTVSFTGDNAPGLVFTGSGDVVSVLQDSMNVGSALNTRLGIFEPGIGSYASSDEVSIDTNHVTGKPFACDGTVSDVSSETQSLPLADCFADNSCGSFSDSAVPLEDLQTYWEKAHGGQLPAVDFKGEPFQSRYDVYLHEVATGLVDPEGTGSQGPRSDCHPTKPATETEANRRLFEVAMVDCTGLSDVTQTDVAVEGFATVFLSEAVDTRQSFVLTFDDEVDMTDDGIDNPQPMLGGDVVNDTAPAVNSGSPSYYDPYAAQGLEIYAVANRSGSRGYNIPMLLDSQNGWDEDPDLKSVDMGNIIIISENSNSNRPDDHAQGGALIFSFDEPTVLEKIVFFDGEENDSKLRLYTNPIDVTNLNSWTNSDQFVTANGPGDIVIDVPVIGDGKHRSLYITLETAYQNAKDAGIVGDDGVYAMVYDMAGSGAIDELVFTNSKTTSNKYDDVLVEFLDVIDGSDSQVVTYPVISN